MALFGVGDLGRALLSYRGFEERGFHIAAAFDVDSEKVGRVYAGRRCYHVDHLETVLREFDVHMAILASRPEGLQTLVDRVSASGVHAVLNFVLRASRPRRLPRRGERHRVQLNAALVPERTAGRAAETGAARRSPRREATA